MSEQAPAKRIPDPGIDQDAIYCDQYYLDVNPYIATISVGRVVKRGPHGENLLVRWRGTVALNMADAVSLANTILDLHKKTTAALAAVPKQ